MDYRPIPDADERAFFDISQYAFSPEEHATDESFEERKPYDQHNRGLYDGDELLAISGWHDFTLSLRGEWVRVGGVSSVATPPEHRRKGYVQRMLADMLAEFRDEGIDYSALWPFEYEFYHKYGWGTCNKRAQWQFDTEALEGSIPKPEGEFRRLSKDDNPALQALHERFAEGWTLAMRRTENWWEHRIFESSWADPYVYGWERDGDLRAAVVYSVKSETGGMADTRTLRAWDVAYRDDEAYGHLLRFFYHHLSQMDRVHLFTAADTSLFDRVRDPRALDCTIHPGPMFRLTDVVSGLARISYPETAAGRVVLDVSDPLVSWNDDRFELTLEGGGATVEKTTDPASVSVDIATLSQLAVGYLTPAEGRRYGGLSTDSEAAMNLLAAAFPRERTYLREFF